MQFYATLEKIPLSKANSYPLKNLIPISLYLSSNTRLNPYKKTNEQNQVFISVITD